MSSKREETPDPLFLEADEIMLTETFGTTEPTPDSRLDVEITNLNHAMELMHAGAINGFECFSLLGDNACIQYRVRRWSAGGFQLKVVTGLGQESSGFYGLFEDPKAQRAVVLVHEHQFGPSPALPEMPVAKFRAI